ncbi:hypothetical protein [Methyloglobulus sp.]|uniref:hypothetical protein n=1 Tax=Methyloglobulus sp. TaxID=2518622 RepID=UPI0032B7A698
MKRKTFLSVASFIALAVGTFALIAPAILLESKGVVASAATEVWVREVGALLISVGVSLFLVRDHGDSPTLKAFFIGNIMLQLSLLIIEPLAYANGIITKLSGIVPNTILHILLVSGFIYYWAKMQRSNRA